MRLNIFSRVLLPAPFRPIQPAPVRDYPMLAARRKSARAAAETTATVGACDVGLGLPPRGRTPRRRVDIRIAGACQALQPAYSLPLDQSMGDSRVKTLACAQPSDEGVATNLDKAPPHTAALHHNARGLRLQKQPFRLIAPPPPIGCRCPRRDMRRRIRASAAADAARTTSRRSSHPTMTPSPARGWL